MISGRIRPVFHKTSAANHPNKNALSTLSSTITALDSVKALAIWPSPKIKAEIKIAADGRNCEASAASPILRKHSFFGNAYAQP